MILCSMAKQTSATSAYQVKDFKQADQDHWAAFDSGLEAEAAATPQTPLVQDVPETYQEFYTLVIDRLFKTSAEEGIAFLGNYIERRGSLMGWGSALRKHSYFKEDIAKSHPNASNRIEEALVQLRDTRRENEDSLTLDDVVATSYILADEFDRRATFLLAYEMGYLEARALGVSIIEQPPQEMRRFFAAAGLLAGSPRLANMQFTPVSRSPTKTEGEAYVADILQWMDCAAAKRMPLKELMPKIHFLLHDGPQLYATAVQDITEKKYAAGEAKLTGLRTVADKGLANIEGPIVYQLAQIALKTKDNALAEQRLRECVMMTSCAFPSRYGVKQEDAYRELLVLHQRQKKTTEALLALEHLQRYYPQSALLGTHKNFIEEHAFAEGKSAFTTGDLETAVKCFSLETIVKPKNSWAWYYLGMTEHKKKKWDLAQAAYVQAIHINPPFATKDFNEATTFFTKKEYTKALWAIERAGEVAHYSDKAPRQKIADIANKIGALFKDGKDVAKDYTAATRAFTAALAADANNADAHYHIGTIAMMQKKYDVAQQAFSCALASKPKHAWAFYQLGRTYDALKRTSDAQTAYASAAGLGHVEAKKLLKK